MCLGYRSRRRENPWFRLCWGLSGLLLAIHIALDILAATPVMGWIAGNPAVNWGLTWTIRGMDLLLLFALWRGSRAAFRTRCVEETELNQIQDHQNQILAELLRALERVAAALEAR